MDFIPTVSASQLEAVNVDVRPLREILVKGQHTHGHAWHGRQLALNGEATAS
jgi:hypothetical protein